MRVFYTFATRKVLFQSKTYWEDINMKKTKKKKSGKAVKVIGIILAVIIVLFGSFTIVSHAVYHRSDMATAVELLFRIQGSKKTFSDPQKVADFIEKRAEAEDYVLDASKLKSNVSEEQVDGSRVYTLTSSDTPEYLVLYLHGGAYINDATVYHWKLCDRLAQKINAEVVFPLYPLTPIHTWDETYELITDVYRNIVEDTEIPVIVMGDSAGGGLAVAFCEYLATIDLPQPDRLILFSPWMDISMANPDAANYESVDPMLSAYGLAQMGKCWAGDLALTDYRLSPIYGDVSMLRNVTLFVGTREIFYPDVTAFYQMLQDKGIESELFIGEGMNHVYTVYPIPEADTAFDQIADAIRRGAAGQ